MKILLVNKYHYLRGGDCKYVFGLARLLEKKGHMIRHFSMHHPQNFKYDHDDDFVSYVDFLEESKKRGINSKLRVVSRMLYSKEARNKFRKVLNEFKPNIIHLNNIHKHLTTSILLEANKQKIPIVWTLHDYNIICPNILFMSKNAICEKCKKRKYLARIIERCSNNSIAASSIIAIEQLLHNIQGIEARINYFISPSLFLKNKFVEYGFAEKKILVLPNFYESSKIQLKRNIFRNRYYLFLGRISAEKGIATLWKAARDANINLVIAGQGPLKEELEKSFASQKIKFVSYTSGKELISLRRNAWFVVVPSEVYENNPFSIIESFADRVPAIGSRIGGIPELIKENVTGFLFNYGNVQQLKELLVKTSKLSISQRNRLGSNSRKLVEKNNNPDHYYSELMKIYNKAILEEKSKWKQQ